MNDDEIEERNSSPAAGAAVLTVAAGGVGAAVFVYSRDVFVLLVWALGAAAVWYASRNRVQSAPNRTPPPVPERAVDEEPQVIALRDPSHPNRWLVIEQSEWLDWDPEEEQETGTE